jgi:molybdopterin-guanine dinucleotide biosynthesis protein A
LAKVDGVAGILLAGGLSRRMGGGDKCLRKLGEQTILARIVETVSPQIDVLALNANGDPGRFSSYGLPVVPDTVAGNVGPLAGVLAGLEWVAKHYPECPWVVTVPTDAPFLPEDLVAKLASVVSAEGSDMACAASGGRHHPVCGLWPVRLCDALRDAITAEEIRQVDRWTGRYSLSTVEFSTSPYDPFFNTNRPEDLSQAEILLSQIQATV